MKQAATPLSIETPTKLGNTDRGLMKKLKEFDGLAMSIGNGTAEIAEGGAEHRMSERFVESFSRLCNMLTFFFLRIWYHVDVPLALIFQLDLLRLG
jgi:hypothetical protein